MRPPRSSTSISSQQNKTSTSSSGSRNSSSSVTQVPFSKYKGVVYQQKGRWGAQIYSNHRRFWLGTFHSEIEAAVAYDRAAIKLRLNDTHRNLPPTKDAAKEALFQSSYTEQQVLTMLKNDTYTCKFQDFLHIQKWVEIKETDNRGGDVAYTFMFQKVLTPSDVGSLNRLVIPKHYALKYFPAIAERGREVGENDGEGGGVVEEIHLSFNDREMNKWRFRYCFWASSQSYVFTRGWSYFVRSMKARAGDVVSFYMCRRKDDGKRFCMIDVGLYEGGGEYDVFQSLYPKLHGFQEENGEEGDERRMENVEIVRSSPPPLEKNRVRLFGVYIS